jgi:hypothetical protein
MLFLAVLHQVLALLRREICLFRNIVAVLQLLLVGRKVGFRTQRTYIDSESSSAVGP